MPGRISKHAFAVEFGRAKTKHVRRRVSDTLDHDVEVYLLRDGRVRPGRRTMVRSELKRQAGGRVAGRDDHVIVACVGDRMVQECGVEPCEPSRVGTVEDDVVRASAHALNGLSRRPLFVGTARSSRLLGDRSAGRPANVGRVGQEIAGRVDRAAQLAGGGAEVG